ncbi:hypothetical protein [Desulfosporosinus shakirovi]|uniref:hypothetical protein n=1 Tax=Desulfosporosinus shakirovi TaxID=2885154 RepID=UPI001E425F8B|nr:hypothetical protein [Desulfosporosinus sp. SRJS8]MCB8818804.1 hypothetical protein [Desulfosporosinus sp. SRJS8]
MNMDEIVLDGEIDSIDFSQDFPYEIEKRYRKMVREDRDYAEPIFDYLVGKRWNTYRIA